MERDSHGTGRNSGSEDDGKEISKKNVKAASAKGKRDNAIQGI
jgi:hypothetical protein